MAEPHKIVFKSAFKDDSYPWIILFVQVPIYILFLIGAVGTFSEWRIATFGVPFFAAMAWLICHIIWRLKVNCVHTPPLVVSDDGILVSRSGLIAWSNIKTMVEFSLGEEEDISLKNKRALGIVTTNLPMSKKFRLRFQQRVLKKCPIVAGEMCYCIFIEGITEESFEKVCLAICQHTDIQNIDAEA